MFRACSQRVLLILLVAVLTAPRLEQAWGKTLSHHASMQNVELAALDLNDEGEAGLTFYESCEAPDVSKSDLTVLFALPPARLTGLNEPASQPLCRAITGRGKAPARAWIEACNRGPPMVV